MKKILNIIFFVLTAISMSAQSQQVVVIQHTGNQQPQSPKKDTVTKVVYRDRDIVVYKPKPVAKQNTPYILLDYLKVYPEDLGEFNAVPTNIIANLNKQRKYGYNTWRIPTEEELSLMYAEHIVVEEGYMTSDSKIRRGKVRLVTDKETAAVLAKQAAEEAQSGAEHDLSVMEWEKEKNRLREIARNAGYIDLGLPSGTLWKKNAEGVSYTYYEAMRVFGNQMPTKAQLEELKTNCKLQGYSREYLLESSNGESIVIAASMWSSTSIGNETAWYLDWAQGQWGTRYTEIRHSARDKRYGVRLVATYSNIEQIVQEEAEKARKREIAERLGYVDLGLPSGTLWKIQNEKGLYTYDQAKESFGDQLPSWEQMRELQTLCYWRRENGKAECRGLNNAYIYFPREGIKDGSIKPYYVGEDGYYWSSSLKNSDSTYYFHVSSRYDDCTYGSENRRKAISVRLVVNLENIENIEKLDK